jgi:hypothetical protein
MPDGHDAPPAAEGAVFAPTRVHGSRRGRMLAFVAIAAMAGVVAIGALERAAAAPQTAAVTDASAPPAATQPTQALRSSRPPPRGSLGPGSEHGSTAHAPITLDVQLADDHVFVHGEAFHDVARVAVRIQDSAGHRVAARSVELPSGSTALRIGAVPRFEAHFVLPDKIRADGFLVSATALDAAGRKLSTVHDFVAGAATVTSPHADPLFPTDRVLVVQTTAWGDDRRRLATSRVQLAPEVPR